MRRIKIGAAAVLAAALCSPLAVGTADADERTTPPGVNARGMSPNVTGSTARVPVNWTNAKTAFDFFVSKGLSKGQASGIIGNLIVESGMDPTIHQIGGGPGRGIAQWSAGGRWDTYAQDNNVWYAGTIGLGAKTLNAQLRFTWYELSTFSYYGLADLKRATVVSAATRAFMTKFEGCGTCHEDRRIDYALQTYDRFA